MRRSRTQKACDDSKLSGSGEGLAEMRLPPSALDPWCTPPSPPRLGRDEVHVWLVELDVAPPRLEELRAVLSADERERAERFVFSKLRRRFVVAHAVLRMVLGQYVETDPSRLAFRYAAHGKPALESDPGHSVPKLNLAHSSDLALIAVSLDRVVGVDLEKKHWRESLEGVASRYFSAKECELIHGASPESKADCFFSLWAKKEAILKATGDGIFALTRIEVWPELKVRSGRDRAPPAAAGWTLADLPPIPGFASALAVAGSGARLAFWHWPH